MGVWIEYRAELRCSCSLQIGAEWFTKEIIDRLVLCNKDIN